jgi:NAD(P)-dependent dehydrogenase (short-subunit alcohol dehydrogenase family)
MDTVLITGASRGIGLELATQYASDGWQVFACCRNPESANELQVLSTMPGASISLHRVDVDDHASINALAEELSGEEIDILINNAGVSGNRAAGVGSMDYQSFADTIHTNVSGPLKVTEAFSEHVSTSYLKIVVMISSRMGSVADTTSGGSMIYRTSKAALNMVMKCLALELKSQGVTLISVHPGWVRTDMGGTSATLSVGESASALRALFYQLRLGDSGKFYNYDGLELPW